MKVKTKTIYVNKELEKRMNAKDKADAKAYMEKKKAESKPKKTKDPIAHAHKMSSKSPKSMFKESMAQLHKLSNKKSAKKG